MPLIRTKRRTLIRDILYKEQNLLNGDKRWSFWEAKMKLRNTYKVGIYCRLSRDDNNGSNESMSISNQRDMLMSYVNERGWEVSEIYVDDGYSGTTFDRPDFQRMIRDVELKKINMIIIESKRGKSRKLEEILNGLETNESKYIYMFDAVGVNLDVERLIVYSNLGNDYDRLLDWSKVCLGKYIDMGYIVFEYNVPIEMKNKFIERLTYCKNCTTCSPGYDIKISGKLYKHVCEKSLYYKIDNPIEEQIEWIVKFIHARIEYIENHVV
jgi:hypothetical protein